MRVLRLRFSSVASSVLTSGVLAFLWTPILWLYGAVLWRVLATQPARLLEALPFSLLPRTLFLNTLMLCGLTALLSLFLGTIVALFLERQKNFRFVAIPFILPLAISPTLMATAYLEISRTPPLRAAASLGAEQTLSINSIFIAGPVLALCFYPVVAFAVAAARRAIPSELLDAARLFGSSWSASLRVLAPLLAPAAFASLGIVAALSMWEMGAPDLLDVRTYSVQIYRDFSAQQNTEKAALDALPMLFLGALCFFPAWRAMRFYKGFETVSGAARCYAPQSKIPAFAAFFVFAFSPLAPIAVFVTQMRNPEILWTIWQVNREEIINTVLMATMAGVLIIAFAAALAATWRAYSPRMRNVLLIAVLGSLLCAPVMLAVAYLSLYNRAAFDFAAFENRLSIYDSRYGLLLLGLFARFLPAGVLWLHEALQRIPKSYDEAGANLGATQMQNFLRITAPLLAPATFGLFAVVWALCATELSLSVLLNAPGGQTLPVPIFNQMHIGATAEVAALSLILTGLTAGVLCLPLLLFLRLRRSN